MCCMMIGLFSWHSILGVMNGALKELKEIIEEGQGVKVLVNETSSFSRPCDATCKDTSTGMRSNTGEELHETTYPCQKVTGDRAECPCAKKQFFIESNTTFGPNTGCLVVEHVDVDDKKTSMYGSDIDAIFLPEGKHDITTNTLMIGWNRQEALKKLDDWIAALDQALSGAVGGAVMGILCMICSCAGGGFMMYKGQKAPSAQQNASPGNVVMGQPVASPYVSQP